MTPAIDSLILKNAIRLLVGGALYDDSIHLGEIPSLLREMAEDYAIEIARAEEATD